MCMGLCVQAIRVLIDDPLSKAAPKAWNLVSIAKLETAKLTFMSYMSGQLWQTD